MKKWWIGAALAAMCLSQSARGQYPPGGGALLPEPAPVAPSGGQDESGHKFMPGPLPGGAAPPGPDNTLALPVDIPSAWGKGPTPESAAYLHLGAMALMRERPGRTAVAEDDGVTVLNTHNLDPEFQLGARATIGYLCDDAAIELTGFYLPEDTTTASIVSPGQLTLPFFHPPAGFQGARGVGLWAVADSASINLQSSLGDVELNYRWWSRAFTSVEGIVGFRYVELQEQTNIAVADNVTGAGLSSLPVAALEATYLARVHNHMLLPQVGFEWNYPIASWLNFALMAKVAAGADNIDQTTRLTNGEGLVGLQGRDNRWTWAGLYEVGAYFDLVTLEKMRLRAGYMGMGVVHVGEALQQVNYNLAAPGGARDSGSIYYHGPVLEMQFLF